MCFFVENPAKFGPRTLSYVNPVAVFDRNSFVGNRLASVTRKALCVCFCFCGGVTKDGTDVGLRNGIRFFFKGKNERPYTIQCFPSPPNEQMQGAGPARQPPQ